MNLLFNQVVNFTIRYWLYLTIYLFSVIAIMSLIPQPELPEIPGKDKTLHFIAYATLALPCALAKPRKWWILTPIFFMLCSGFIEIIQPFVNRYGEWFDLLANAIGIISGTIIGLIIRHSLFTGSK